MLAVILHGARLVIIIVTGDSQDGDVNPVMLLLRESHRIPILVRVRVGDPGLEMGRSITDDSIQLFVGQAPLVKSEILEFKNRGVDTGHIACDPADVSSAIGPRKV